MSTPTPTPIYYLFSRPSFWEGWARVSDVGSTLAAYNDASTPTEADTLALLSDWLATGQDIQSAISAYDRSVPVEKK